MQHRAGRTAEGLARQEFVAALDYPLFFEHSVAMMIFP
jgi:hypothetical protein